jgi:hypothetical protein
MLGLYMQVTVSSPPLVGIKEALFVFNTSMISIDEELSGTGLVSSYNTQLDKVRFDCVDLLPLLGDAADFPFLSDNLILRDLLLAVLHVATGLDLVTVLETEEALE